jgi:hypothetical protein
MRRALAAGLILWLVTGIVLFSHMIRLHPRYVEGFTPSVAAVLGIGVAWAAAGRDRLRLGFLLGTLAVTVYYVERLLYGRPLTWWVTLAAALAAAVLAITAYVRRARPPARVGLLNGAICALALVAVLAMPVKADITAIHDHVTDAGYVGALPSEEQRLVSAYLRAHREGARYEVAAESATQIGSLIVQDGLPVRVLTTYNGQVFTTVAQLRRLIAEGQVRYAFLNTFCGHTSTSANPACAEPVKWVREHGVDVSREAGLPRGGLLYRLPGAPP